MATMTRPQNDSLWTIEASGMSARSNLHRDHRRNPLFATQLSQRERTIRSATAFHYRELRPFNSMEGGILQNACRRYFLTHVRRRQTFENSGGR